MLEVKLKCVSNVDYVDDASDYLTIGKIYNATDYGHGLYEIIDDEGELIHVRPQDDAHGKWEVVNE